MYNLLFYFIIINTIREQNLAYNGCTSWPLCVICQSKPTFSSPSSGSECWLQHSGILCTEEYLAATWHPEQCTPAKLKSFLGLCTLMGLKRVPTLPTTHLIGCPVAGPFLDYWVPESLRVTHWTKSRISLCVLHIFSWTLYILHPMMTWSLQYIS